MPACKFPFRPHLPLDVGAGLGQQGFQNRLSRLLVEAMLRIGLRGTERLLEEGDAHPLGAADLTQGSPGSRACP